MVEIGRVYKHTKSGKLYKIIALAKDADTLDDIVVYEALYENPVSKVWVRPLVFFVGTTCWNGQQIQRFSKV